MLSKLFKRLLETRNADRLQLGFGDEPGDRVEIDADRLHAEPGGFDDGGAAAHEGVENDQPLGVRVLLVGHRDKRVANHVFGHRDVQSQCVAKGLFDRRNRQAAKLIPMIQDVKAMRFPVAGKVLEFLERRIVGEASVPQRDWVQFAIVV